VAAAMSEASIESRLERLEAAEDIRSLLRRYTSTMDALPPISELADLFTEDATLNTGSAEVVGRAAILEHYDRVLSPLVSCRHYLSNSTIEPLGPGVARHRSYFVALLNGEGEAKLIQGDYDDELVRGADGAWRFRRKGNQGTIVIPVDPTPHP
jgi:uncharacterized protein (TIGR02246 family)